MTFKNLKRFVEQVSKKYGKAANKMRVEVHHPEHTKDGLTLWIPHDLTKLAVATYAEDKENEYPRETVVVIR